MTVIVVKPNPSTREIAEADIVVIGRRLVKHRGTQTGRLLTNAEIEQLKRGTVPASLGRRT